MKFSVHTRLVFTVMECYTVYDLSAELNESVDLPLSNQSIAAIAELKGKNSAGASP
jgi:hypothetical protein